MRPTLSATPPAELFEDASRFSSPELAGRGASGIVYSVWDETRRERVAVKVLNYVSRGSSTALARQIEGLCTVDHPNLVRIHELVFVGDRPAIVMELVEGHEFMSYVRAGRAAPGFDLDRLRSSIAQLLGALSALHATYRVHRDVKPSNLRVTRNGRLVLLDLGIVADLAELGTPGAFIGTPAYMSPEQVSGDPVGRASDMYALGVVLYEVLTGSLPHPSASQHVSVKLTQAPVPVRTLVRDAPVELAELTMRLLSRDPHARPSAREVLSALGLPMDAAGIALPVPLKSPGVLHGREDELRVLFARFDAARAGRGGFLHVHGPPGRGKSALLESFVATVRAERPDATVVHASFRHAADAPYGAIDALIEALVPRLGRRAAASEALHDAAWAVQAWPSLGVVPWLSNARPKSLVPDLVERRLRAEHVLARLFSLLGTDSPLLCVADDLDHVGVDALQVLSTLHAHSAGSRVLVVTAGRAPSCAQLSGVERLALGPLRSDGAVATASEMLRRAGERSDVPPGLVDAACGEPRAVIELTRAHLLGARVTSEREAVAARLRVLQDKTLDVLRLLCVACVPMTRDATGLAAGMDGAQVRLHLAELLDASLVERRLDASGAALFEPESELVSQVVLAELEDDARAVLHAEWASALVSSVVPRPSLVFHAEHGRAHERAAEYARKAAELAHSRLAFTCAAELRTRAEQLSPSAPRDTGRRTLQHWGESLALAGRPAEAAEVCARAAVGASASEELALLVRRAELLIRAGLFGDGLTAAKDVLGAVGLDLPVTTNRAFFALVYQRIALRVRGFGYRARAEREIPARTLIQIDMLLDTAGMLTAANPIIGTELLSRALRRALSTGEPRRVARSLMLESSAQATLETPPLRRAPALLTQAKQILESHPDPALERDLVRLEGFIAFQSFRMREAAEVMARADRAMRDHAMARDVEVVFVRQYLLYALVFLGDYRGLCETYRASMRDAERRGDVHAIVTLTTAVGATVAACLDTPAEGERELDEALARLPTRLDLYDLFAVLSRWCLAAYSGDLARVAQVLEGLNALRGAFFSKVKGVRAALDMSEACVRLCLLQDLAAEARAKELARIERLVPRSCPYPSIAAEWPRIRAAIALSKGDRALAQRELELHIELRRTMGASSVVGEYLLARLRDDVDSARSALDALAAQGIVAPEKLTRLWGVFGAGGIW